MKFSSKDFFIKCGQVTFTEELLNRKLHFLCNVALILSNLVTKRQTKTNVLITLCFGWGNIICFIASCR